MDLRLNGGMFFQIGPTEYIYIYIYIYISVKEFERLLHCRSPLIFSFIYSIELSVDVEVKKFGALAMLCTVSHIIVNLYIWVSHT